MRRLALLFLLAGASACIAPQPELPAPRPGQSAAPQFPPPALPPSRAPQPEIGPELVQAKRYLFDVSGEAPRLVEVRSYRTVGVDSRDNGQRIAITAFDDDGGIVASASRPHPAEARTAGPNHGDLEFQPISGEILVDAVWPVSLRVAEVLVEIREGPGAEGRVNLR